MAFFPGVGAKEGVKGPKTSVVQKQPQSPSVGTKGMSGPRPMSAAGTSKAPTPKNLKGKKANPFAPIVRKST